MNNNQKNLKPCPVCKKMLDSENEQEVKGHMNQDKKHKNYLDKAERFVQVVQNDKITPDGLLKEISEQFSALKEKYFDDEENI